MKFGVSPITNTIYAGNTRKTKSGTENWVSKTDVTDEAVRAVFEWFMNNEKEDGTGTFEVSFGEKFGTLTYKTRV